MTSEHESRTKPRRCPACGGRKIASILYGLPAPDEKMMAKLDSGELVLGGCCVSDHDPAWRCMTCEAHIYKQGNALLE